MPFGRRTENRKIRPRRPCARVTFIHEMNAYAISDARRRSDGLPRNSTATSQEDKRETGSPVVPWPRQVRTEVAEARKNQRRKCFLLLHEHSSAYEVSSSRHYPQVGYRHRNRSNKKEQSGFELRVEQEIYK